MTDSPKPIGDPPLTPEQLLFWREKMCLSAGVKFTDRVSITSHPELYGAWLVDNRAVSETTAKYLMDQARRLRP